MKHPAGPVVRALSVMVAKGGSGHDPLRSALEALAIELETIAKSKPAAEPAELERRAKVLASLSKTAELLSELLRERQTQDEKSASNRSPENYAAQRRDVDVWKEIERRLARLRAAEEEAPDSLRLGANKREILLDDWRVWAHPARLPPDDDWRFWLIMGGRGSGKTRAGAEWLRAQAESGRRGRLALVGPTLADVREVMVGGDSGLLAISPRECRPYYEPSRRRLVWPNGAQAFAFSAEDPDSLRGPQFDSAWCDEFAAWPRGGAVLQTLDMALRLGARPRAVITTTPRPTATMRALLKMPGLVVSKASTGANAANLAPGFLSAVTARYGGTVWARQELDGDLIDDAPGALFKRGWIDDARIPANEAPPFRRIVVGVDPSAGGGAGSDECGIVVAGLGARGDRKAYVLADWSLRAQGPEDWARKAMAAFDHFKADCVIAEANQGGEMVRTVLGLSGPKAAVRLVHATRGKHLRAEPIATLYQQQRIGHVGMLPELEDQMCSFGVDGERCGDDRVDALVWALWALMIEPPADPHVRRL